MKYFIALIISFNCFAAKLTGEVIKADDFNSSIFNIGDIKQSFLPEVSFKKLNGSCWTLLDGKNVATSDYGIFLTSEGLSSTIPDARGMFLRGQNNGRSDGKQNPENKLLAEYQSDDNKSHDHSVYTSSNQAQSYNLSSQGGHNQIGNINWTGAQDTNSKTDSNGSEARPKNLSINYFIKINKQCNFN